LKNFKKTRIAPTPSGFLHLGNVLSFALTAALARKTGASTLLRIDDLDRERVTGAFLEDIFDTLRFMGILWDEGPADTVEFELSWSQVHRMEVYRQALSQLRLARAVFACSCSRAEVLRAGVAGGCAGDCKDRGLSLDTPGIAWRLKTEGLPWELRVKKVDGGFVDAVLPSEMRDFVVMKKDGFPAYQLTSLVDDAHYGVDLIVRGDDLWPSTLAQHCLSYALGASGFREIAFYHHAIMVSDDGEKLSKSAGDTSIRYLRQSGLGPADIYSLILRKLGVAGRPSG
jgi:glutamyl/glutaminyl-tRNA synthetase